MFTVTGCMQPCNRPFRHLGRLHRLLTEAFDFDRATALSALAHDCAGSACSAADFCVEDLFGGSFWSFGRA